MNTYSMNNITVVEDAAVCANRLALRCPGWTHQPAGFSQPVLMLDNKYWTGNPCLDAQHRELFDILNELYFAMVEGRDDGRLNLALVKLEKCAWEHFATEELMMDVCQCPGLQSHRAKHAAFIKKAAKLIDHYKSGRLLLPMTVPRLLADWLKQHILEEDMALVDWLNSRQTMPLAQ